MRVYSKLIKYFFSQRFYYLGCLQVCETCGTVSQRTDDFYELRVRVPNQTVLPNDQGTKKKAPVTKKKKTETSEAIKKEDEEVKDEKSSLLENESTSPAEMSPVSANRKGLLIQDGTAVEASTISSVSNPAGHVFHIEKGLAQLFQSEQLRGDNRYMCNQCHSKVDALRSVSLASLPPYLHICFERYAYDGGGRKKLTTAVDYPLTLSLKEFREKDQPPIPVDIKDDCSKDDPSKDNCAQLEISPNELTEKTSLSDVTGSNSDDDDVYELIGILEHHGSSAQSGHYVAYLRDMSASSVGEKKESEVLGSRKVLLRPLPKGLAAAGKAGAKSKAARSVADDDNGRKRRAKSEADVSTISGPPKKRKDSTLHSGTVSVAPPTEAVESAKEEESRKRRTAKSLMHPEEEGTAAPGGLHHRKRKKSEIRSSEKLERIAPSTEAEQRRRCEERFGTESSDTLREYAEQPERMGEQTEKERLDEILCGGNLPPRKKPRYHPNHPKVVETPGAHRTISHKARSHIHTGHVYFYPGRYSGDMMFPAPPEMFPSGVPPPEFTDPSAMFYHPASFAFPPPMFSMPYPMAEFFPPISPGVNTAVSTAGVPISHPTLMAPPPPSAFNSACQSYPVVPGTLVTQSNTLKKNSSDKSSTTKHLILSPIGLPPAPSIPSSPLLGPGAGLQKLTLPPLPPQSISTEEQSTFNDKPSTENSDSFRDETSRYSQQSTSAKFVGWVTTATTRPQSGDDVNVCPVSPTDGPTDVPVMPDVIGVGPQSALGPGGLLIRPAGVVIGNNAQWIGSGQGLSGGLSRNESEHNQNTVMASDETIKEEDKSLYYDSPKSVSSVLPRDSEPSDAVPEPRTIGSRITANKRQVSIPVHSLLANQSDNDDELDEETQPSKAKRRVTRQSRESDFLPSTKQSQIGGASLDRRWQWISFDDASVAEWKIQNILSPDGSTSVEESGRLTSRTAYLLIYKKKSWTPASEPVPPKGMEDAVTAIVRPLYISALYIYYMTISSPVKYYYYDCTIIRYCHYSSSHSIRGLYKMVRSSR